MKKWIYKTWVKVLLFCLLVLFTILVVPCGAGIIYLAENNAYVDGGEQIYRDTLESSCLDEIDRVYGFLLDNSEIVSETPDEQFIFKFRTSFKDSLCSLVITCNGEEILKNYDITGESPYSQEVDFYINGKHLTITASADPEGKNSRFSFVLISKLIRRRNLLIILEAVFIGGWIFSLVSTLLSAGHRYGEEGIKLSFVDKIPIEIWVVAALLLMMALAQIMVRTGPFALLFFLIPIPLFYLFLTVLAAQCKAGTLIRDSLTARILRIAKKVLLWLFHLICSIPMVWKTALAVTGVLVFDVFCIFNSHDEEFLVALLLVNILAGVYLIYLATGLKKLYRGGKALASGDYEHTIDTKYMFGDYKRHAENLNSIQAGVQRAVEQQIRSERMKTELITNVSHDIKTPLTSIINYVDLLNKEEGLPPAAQEYVSVLERQANRLKKLTDDLVEASKASTGNIPVTLSDTDVNVFMTQIVGEYRQKLLDNQIEPVLTLDKGEPHINADGRLLWRVMDNLLSNICKYAMPGTIAYLSSETINERVVISLRNVSKYPLNISAEELTERFVRGDTSRSIEGSGLGLSIAKDLIKLQGGSLGIVIDGDLFKVHVSFERQQVL